MSKIQNAVNFASDIALNSTVAASIGYLCARAFMAINPVHAAVACAVSFAVSTAVKPLFQKMFAGENANAASRLVGTVLSDVVVFAPIAIALGSPIPLGSFFCLIAIIEAARNAFTIGRASTDAQDRYFEDAIDL